ncbi:MAG: 5'-3' exoribonuclease [Methanobacteriota archaeon]|jgi:predicted metal-dependent phosphoesterase TrpH|nr:MAG: 5'-3' exoribonuclease [Euryarchaeota archaeon]|tara:strand:- start:469 stop:1317 length:849 start_codon:yes stop_codon:yes gene_type:complete
MWTQLVDLHSHSHHSDGLWSPAEMAKRAHANGVKVWSLTDHDTSAGWSEAQIEAERLGIKFVPGVEITCAVELEPEKSLLEERQLSEPSSWHVLAYFPEGCSEEFESWLESQKEARLPRMIAMIEALEKLGHIIDLEDVKKHAEGSLGRPHLARTMVEYGIVESVQQAFDEWIGDDGPAYRSRPLPSVGDAIEMVHEHGGITSLAHSKYYCIQDEVLMAHLVKIGMDCIEAFHHSHSDSMRYNLMNYGMPVTVGGDSHGTERRPSPGGMLVPIKHLHPCFHP